MITKLNKSMSIDNTPFAYSVRQLALIWVVSSRHVYDLCATGKLGHLRVGSLIRIRQIDKDDYENRNWHPPQKPEPPAAKSKATLNPPRNQIYRGSAFERGRSSSAKRRTK